MVPETATDIVIVGGGLAGSSAAAMLGRAGCGVTLVDPHAVYPPDFRAEKIDGGQARILARTGLADAVLRAATHDGACWVARRGRLIDKRPGDQYGIRYDTLVNTIRRAIPANVGFVCGKVAGIATGAERQTVTLSNGDTIAARLVVVANGLNRGLRERLGLHTRELSKCHSIMLGFDFVPKNRVEQRGAFPALTWYGERPADRTAYLTLFPIGATMRANLCVYRAVDDPWLRAFRAAPRDTLMALLPGLARITGRFEIHGDVQIRPADLTVTTGVRRDGIVLIGDAFATSCPAAGTGHRQGVHRRRAAVQRARPALARHAGHGRRQDRGVLRRSGEDRL
jgi:2-polyprenyl-6-methoxyphenol hydroxylase-like FAD-dependent oxidoreductase